MGLNKKGFTLVELLAVIVILAVVMLIAVTAVGPLMTRTRKSALATEGLGLIEAAETAFQAEQLATSSKIKATSDVCFDMKWLYDNGYFEKGSGSDGYTGSVFADYDTTTKKHTYTFWISNGTYKYGADGTSNSSTGEGINPTSYDPDTDAVDGATASANCGYKGAISNTVNCTGSSCTVVS